jgi:hypothetical protein
MLLFILKTMTLTVTDGMLQIKLLPSLFAIINECSYIVVLGCVFAKNNGILTGYCHFIFISFHIYENC